MSDNTNGNTAGGDQQAARLREQDEKIAKLEKQVQDKQAFIDQRNSEVGEVRSLKTENDNIKTEIETLKDTLNKLVEKRDAEREAQADADAKAKDDQQKAQQPPPKVPQDDGTNPPPSVEDHRKALAEAYLTLDKDARESVDEAFKDASPEQKMLLKDAEAKLVFLNHVLKEKGFKSDTQESDSFWADVAPKPKELSAAEKLRATLSGEAESTRPSVPRTAFTPESGRRQANEQKESSTARRPKGALYDELQKMDKGG